MADVTDVSENLRTDAVNVEFEDDTDVLRKQCHHAVLGYAGLIAAPSETFARLAAPPRRNVMTRRGHAISGKCV